SREIAVVARKALLDRAAEYCKVMRSRQLIGIGQTRSIGKMRAGHANFVRLFRHECSKMRFVSADAFGDRNSYVIRRACNNRFDCVVHTNRFPWTKTQFAWFLCRRKSRDQNVAVESQMTLVELFEQEVESHHLGDRGGKALLVFVAGVNGFAGIA